MNVKCHDDFYKFLLFQIIIIQKYIRRFLAKRRVKRLRDLRDAFLKWEAEEEAGLQNAKEKRLKHDLERRLHPKNRADFDRLFNALETWRREELLKIDSQNLTAAQRKAALAMLLDEETELLAAIGRHQINASHSGQKRANLNLLGKAAAEISWISSVTGRPITVETPGTQRSKELLEIYQSIQMECITIDERIDILLTLKHALAEDKSKICKELTELIDREAELIIRGVQDEFLVGLRRRIINRFMVYAKTPAVNPEVRKYLNVPTGTKEDIIQSLKGDIQYCLACDRYLRKKEFPLSARSKRLGPCKSCRRQENRARKRVDFEPYQHILSELKKHETKLILQGREQRAEDTQEELLVQLERGERPNPDMVVKTDGTDPNVLNSNPYPFLINEDDVRFLVDNVWERRSILSGWLNITDLVFVRWRIHEPWSPWNTILVTCEEAVAHEKLNKMPLEEAYADALLDTVHERLVMARNAFPRLQRNAIRMAMDQVLLEQSMQEPQNTPEWLRQRRERLPRLPPKTTQTMCEERHAPTWQPTNDTKLPTL